MFDLQSTASLLPVLRVIEPESSYWLDTFFPLFLTFDTEELLLDKVTATKQLAPFVSPVVQGRVMRTEGYSTRSFRPAYVKPKHIVDPNKMIARVAGEQPLQPLSPAQKWNAAIVANLEEQKKLIMRRINWMAAMTVIYGQVTVSGPDYPTQLVDFQRHADLTLQLAPGVMWGDAGADPLTDIRNMRKRSFELSGSRITRLTMGLDAFDRFMADPKVKELFNAVTIQNTSDSKVSAISGGDVPVEYMGVLQGAEGQGRIELYTYSETYDNEDGTKVPYMSSYDVIGTGPGINGTRCFGAIKDKRAGLMATDMFPKMWDQEDPSLTYVMTQSAPLPVPSNIDNSFRITVSDGR